MRLTADWMVNRRMRSSLPKAGAPKGPSADTSCPPDAPGVPKAGTGVPKAGTGVSKA